MAERAYGRRMPFGKHKGTSIENVPDGYLDWLLSLDDLRPPLKDWVAEEAQIREELDEERHRARFRAAQAQGYEEGRRLRPPTKKVPDGLERAVRDILKRGYRACAVAHHPDHGGSTDKMQAINEANEWLVKNLRLE